MIMDLEEKRDQRVIPGTSVLRDYVGQGEKRYDITVCPFQSTVRLFQRSSSNNY